MTAILAVVVGVIGACLMAGMRVWRQAQDFTALEAAALIGFTSVEKDFANCIRLSQIPFSGQLGERGGPELRFASLIPDDGVDGGYCIGRVTYLFDRQRGAFLRGQQPLPPGDEEEESPEMESLVDTRLDRVEIEYSFVEKNGELGGWRDTATNIPRVVRITLGLAAAGNRPSAVMERTIALKVTDR